MSSEVSVTYRLPSERIVVEIPDGPTIEVERIHSASVFGAAVALMAGLLNAEGPASFDARSRLCRFLVAEGQPTWDIADHRGAIPPTAEGMLRLPDPLILAALEGWVDSYADKPTAADEMLPEGPVREAVNRKLRSVKKAA